MAHSVSLIGIQPKELRWIRTLIQLLRHPDPSVPELTRQALLYMMDAAARTSVDHPAPSHTADTMDFAG
jgi:hypothetical protein